MIMALKIEELNTIEELKREIRDSKDGKYQLRVTTVMMAKRGVRSKEIQKELLIAPNTYYKWIHKYNEGGLKALKNIRIKGRVEGNPKYEEKIFKEVFEAIDKMEEYWSIPKMQKLVKELHKVEVPYETMRMRVKRAGYSYKSNRPSPYKGNKEKQDSFKKRL